MTLDSLVLIICVSLVTWGLRAAGVVIGAHALKSPDLHKYFDMLPLAVIAAVVAPMIADLSLMEKALALVTIVVAGLTRNVFLTVAIGTGAIALARNWPVV